MTAQSIKLLANTNNNNPEVIQVDMLAVLLLISLGDFGHVI